MSLRVIGYQDGKTIYRDEGPARARPAGNGGQTLGSLTAPTLVHPRSPVPLRTKDQRRSERAKERAICGIRLSSNQNARHNGEPCARKPGHREPTHRSKAAMEHAAAMRRPGLR